MEKSDGEELKELANTISYPYPQIIIDICYLISLLFETEVKELKFTEDAI